MPEIQVYLWDHWITPLGRIGLRLLVLTLVLVPFVLAELRHFRTHRKLRSWALLHAAVLVLAPLAVAPSVLIASGIEGMEALAAFYALLFSLTPLVYLALHYVSGLLLRPRLSLRESLSVAGTSFLTLIGLFLVAAMSEGEFGEARYRARSRARDAAQAHQGPLGQIAAEWFEMPDGVRLAHVTIAPARSFELDRVDLLLGDRRLEGMASAGSTYLCRRGSEYHLSFVATPGETPELSYYWYRDYYPPMFESRISPSLPDDEPVPFTFSQGADGLTSPFPLARSAIRFDRRNALVGRRWLQHVDVGPSMPPHPKACLPELMTLPEITSVGLVISLAGGPEERLEYTFALDSATATGTRVDPAVQ